MRDIKFRAYRNTEGYKTNWFYSDDYKSLEGFFKAVNYQTKFGSKMIVEQFAGLKDKNNKDIYKGDILEHKPYNLKKKVIFKEASFMLETDSGHCVMWGENVNHLEVIGNIHEDPELLNKYDKGSGTLVELKRNDNEK